MHKADALEAHSPFTQTLVSVNEPESPALPPIRGISGSSFAITVKTDSSARLKPSVNSRSTE